MKKLTMAVLMAALASGPVMAQTEPPATPSPTPVSEPRKQPAQARFETCIKPEWPKEALRKEQTGKVILSFLIDLEGKVVESKVVESSGYELLDNAARSGIEKCRFTPATVDGKPVAGWQKMQYIWSLEEHAKPVPEEILARQKLSNKDLAGAASAFKIAAEKGSADAQFQLARMLLLGEGVEKDAAEARKWLEKAAGQRDIASSALYGQLLLKEGGHDEEAFKLLSHASMNNVPSAAYYLGICFEEARGIPRDLERAKGWYRIAAKGGIPEAKEALDELEATTASSAK